MCWGQKNSTQFKYTKNNATTKNDTLKYACNLLKSEFALVNSSIQDDYLAILNGGCSYLPNLFCQENDLSIFSKLKNEIDCGQVVNWSKHFKCENPEFSETFNIIVNKMAEHFNVEIVQTRLNYYLNGTHWKPHHHDKHCYENEKECIREDFTMGASFGATRSLEFQHVESGIKFDFPQRNGDIFAFDSEINKKFTHGIPKISKPIGERFSIIAWGKKIS